MEHRLETIVVKPDSPEAAYAKALYEEAFPEIERFPFESLLDCCGRGKADFFVYRDAGENVGFCVVLLPGRYAYGLFAAIDSDKWNRGYGSQLVREVLRAYPDRVVVLDIEPVNETADNYEERRRRLRFFEKNGFHDTGYEMRDESGPYRILSNGKVSTWKVSSKAGTSCRTSFPARTSIGMASRIQSMTRRTPPYDPAPFSTPVRP
ncbi:MAG: GNAT family N-acetyltransferase [Firmicutes bacterium]|nr:GNAT family N-acetyltransferase [Bacillota bacterium]